MRVRILGPLEVMAQDGASVEIGGARLRTLLIRLALEAGRVVAVESLVDALWPDGPPADPANALQSLISRLRRALPDAAALRSAADGYCLDVPREAVDALAFERLARDGRRLLRDGRGAEAAGRLSEALTLWRGSQLAGAGDGAFVAAAAARLDELRLTAVEDRIDAAIDAGSEPSYLIAELEEHIAVHPFRERLRSLLVRALHADGRQAEALTAFDQYRRLLADELGSDPGPELREAHLAVLRAAPDRSERAGPARPGNLRVPLTSFVGRDEEQRRIHKQLGEGRLVTLIGPGGAGKTRLASTVAEALAKDFEGGVWLVELASVTDPQDVPYAVVGALGLRARGMIDAAASPSGVVDRLVEALSAAPTLIMLDNCEHLLDAAARLADELLGRCPLLRVLATSRESLGIVGEALCPVAPLGLPAPGTPVAQAVEFASIRLFADRVAAVQPGLAVTDETVAAVIEICRRLDGLPLAIELAAARLRSLPLTVLATRLDDRFRLLTGGSRTAVPRHRTLHAVVAWSWDMLEGEERRMAEWLAVFPGLITVRSAGRLEGLAPRVPAAVQDTLAALADKSLLQAVGNDDQQYRMLETIREYGLERLAEDDRLTAVRAEHAGYFLRLVEAAGPELRGPGQLDWLARLTTEHENLLAALHLAIDAGDTATAVRLAAGLGPLWTVQGNHTEATTWLRPVVGLRGPAPMEPRRQATVWYLLNRVMTGGYAGADTGVDPAATDTGESGTDHLHPVSALLEPVAALISDDVVAGRAVIGDRLRHPDPWTRSMLRLLRAFLGANHGDMAAVRDDLDRAASGFRAVGDRWGLAVALTWLANAQTMQGEFANVVATLEESVGLLRELDPSDGAVLQRVWLAVTRAKQGDAQQARAELRELIDDRRDVSAARFVIFARISLGDLSRHEGRLAEAEGHYREAADDLRHAPTFAPIFRGMLNCALGHLALAGGETASARRYLAEAFALATESADMPFVADIGVAVAWLCMRRGDPTAAAAMLGAAHALRGSADALNPDVARLVPHLTGTLGRRDYERAYAATAGLDRADALAGIAAELRPESDPAAG
ncbi:BTAD domain-containing putative transcriptional regulator [Micromonospora sp. CA-259024]|uniref:BTAD domain-containing putative transcriptional regulator n=1 Tax=Micromonospora sp. CA-259024 TaxID=3239965 RepID=UPI003D89C24C